MRRAICPQPIKRHYFLNTREEFYKIMINVLKKLSFFMALVLISGFPVQALGEPIASGFPALNVSTNGDTTEYSFPLQILLLMTVLTVLPSLVLGMTSFTRIIINVNSFLTFIIGVKNKTLF